MGEIYEGALIAVAGEVTDVKSTSLYIDDGAGEVKIYFKKGAGIDSKSIKPGDLVTVTGIVNQAKTEYQLLPRSQSDIQKTGVSPEAAGEINIPENQPVAVAETYLTTTAGGLTALFLGVIAKTRGTVAVALGKRVATLAAETLKKFRA